MMEVLVGVCWINKILRCLKTVLSGGHIRLHLWVSSLMHSGKPSLGSHSTMLFKSSFL